MRKRLITLFAAAALVLALTAVLYQLNNSAVKTYTKDYFALDTYISIRINAPEKQSGYISAILEECEHTTRTLEAMLSHTVEDSDISKINRIAGSGAFTAINKETAEIISIAKEINTLSGGAFDITVAPLVDLWDIKSENPTVPDFSAISAATALADSNSVTLDTQNSLCRLEKSGQKILLGAIAKGYIADRLTDIILGAGIESAIINLGGNTVAIGNKPDGSDWTVGIQHPDKNNKLLGRLSVSDKSVVTSGDYERYFIKDNKRYHHIINPHTGYPAESGLRSVTIVSDYSTIADALSTACFILGKDKSRPLLEQYNCSAIFCDTDMNITTYGNILFEKTTG